MSQLKLLDCTLRDGGYVNDWEFGRNTLVNVFERVASAGIDFVEVGFLDQRRPYDPNRSIAPSTDCMGRLYEGLDRRMTQVVGMIDYGTCDLDRIRPQAESFLDGIRVIFKKHLREEALAFCAELKKLGYKVFTQAVSITSYDDVELMELIGLVNRVRPYAVSIVDTYGLLHKNSLFHYYEMMNAHLVPEVGIGYHSHNNFQLGYANCIELLNRHADRPRTLLVDGSIFGMGKGAGNAPTELLAMYMNENCGKCYDISQLLEAIDVNILEIYRRSPWGYSMKFFIAASNDCHPNYVSYLLDKKTLSVKAINEILKTLAGEKKLLYDQTYIEQLYVDYQRHTCDDTRDYERLGEMLGGREVLVIGPGATLNSERDRIEGYIREKSPVVIAINFVPEGIEPDFLFLTNSKRYVQQASRLSQAKGRFRIVATSNVTRSCGAFDFQLDFERLIDREAVFMDNSFIMLLKVLQRVGARHVALAALDGYSSDRATDYYASELEYESAREKGDQINAYVNRMLAGFRERLPFEFITTTVYQP